MPAAGGELITPRLGAEQLRALMRPMEMDLQAAYVALRDETMGLLEQATREGWTPERFASEVESMWDEPVETEDLVAKALPEVRFQGLPIKIENRPGSVREGVDHDGHPWRTYMKAPYGFIRGTKGADGDEVDIFLGPDILSPWVYVLHLAGPDEDDGYDEDKVVLGCSDLEDAKRLVLSHYDRPMDIEPEMFHIEEFKRRLHTQEGEPIGGEKVTMLLEAQKAGVDRNLVHKAMDIVAMWVAKAEAPIGATRVWGGILFVRVAIGTGKWTDWKKLGKAPEGMESGDPVPAELETQIPAAAFDASHHQVKPVKKPKPEKKPAEPAGGLSQEDLDNLQKLNDLPKDELYAELMKHPPHELKKLWDKAAGAEMGGLMDVLEEAYQAKKKQQEQPTAGEKPKFSPAEKISNIGTSKSWEEATAKLSELKIEQLEALAAEVENPSGNWGSDFLQKLKTKISEQIGKKKTAKKPEGKLSKKTSAELAEALDAQFGPSAKSGYDPTADTMRAWLEDHGLKGDEAAIQQLQLWANENDHPKWAVAMASAWSQWKSEGELFEEKEIIAGYPPATVKNLKDDLIEFWEKSPAMPTGPEINTWVKEHGLEGETEVLQELKKHAEAKDLPVLESYLGAQINASKEKEEETPAPGEKTLGDLWDDYKHVLATGFDYQGKKNALVATMSEEDLQKLLEYAGKYGKGTKLIAGALAAKKKQPAAEEKTPEQPEQPPTGSGQHKHPESWLAFSNPLVSPTAWATEMNEHVKMAAEDPKNLVAIKDFEELANLGGSTGGGARKVKYKDSEGTERTGVIKKGASPGQIRDETTADAIYEMMGAGTKRGWLMNEGGELVMVSAFMEGYKRAGDADAETKKAIREEMKLHFATDALLGNWDVTGADMDNVMWRKLGPDLDVRRIDNGGSLRYRAMGADKGDAFGDTVSELETMRDPNKLAGQVFSDLTDEQVKKQIDDLLAKQKQILAACPDDEVRAKLEKRLAYMKKWAMKPAAKKPTAPKPKAAPKHKESTIVPGLQVPIAPPEVKSVAHAYQGSGFHAMNDFLRTYQEEHPGSDLAKRVKALNDFMEHCPSVDVSDYWRGAHSPMIAKMLQGLGFPKIQLTKEQLNQPVSKGLGKGTWLDYFKKWMTGTKFSDPGFVSTARDKGNAFGTGTAILSTEKGAGCLMHFVSGKAKGFFMQDVTGSDYEHEFLMKPNTLFQIVDIKPSSKGFMQLDVAVLYEEEEEPESKKKEEVA